MLTQFTTYDAAEKIEAQQNWEAFKQPMTGGSQAIEDKALQAYHTVYELTGCERRAADAYFETFQIS